MSASVESRRSRTLAAMRSRRLAAVLLVLYLGTVASVVLWPTDWLAAISIDHLRAIKRDMGAPGWISVKDVGFVANVMLFIPISFLGRALLPRWRWPAWLVAGLVAAFGIEATQMVFLASREPSLADVTANTLGAVLGYLLAVLLFGTRRRYAK